MRAAISALIRSSPLLCVILRGVGKCRVRCDGDGFEFSVPDGYRDFSLSFFSGKRDFRNVGWESYCFFPFSFFFGRALPFVFLKSFQIYIQ